MEIIQPLLHLDETLVSVVSNYGGWTYPILFAVIFAETGLVVTPFLPGDSLLFAAGAIAAAGGLDVVLLALLLCIAAICGDAVNYRIGLMLGERALREGKLFGLPIRAEHLERTRRYYVRYGAKTIVLARFIPIVRTFAPFVAGVGRMPYSVFFSYNVVGGLVWVLLFVFGGYFFGNISVVRENFELVILGIIAVSILPIGVEYARGRLRPKRDSSLQ